MLYHVDVSVDDSFSEKLCLKKEKNLYEKVRNIHFLSYNELLQISQITDQNENYQNMSGNYFHFKMTNFGEKLWVCMIFYNRHLNRFSTKCANFLSTLLIANIFDSGPMPTP